MWNELRKKKKIESKFMKIVSKTHEFIHLSKRQTAGYVMVFLVGFNLKKEIVSSPFLAYN